MSSDPNPFDERDPRSLSDREFKLLIDYRLKQLEDRVNGLFRAMWTIAGGLIVGVGVFFVTGRSTAAHAATMAARLLGL